jgi:hypothetical protein
MLWEGEYLGGSVEGGTDGLVCRAGHANDASHRFCATCGAPLSAVSPALEETSPPVEQLSPQAGTSASRRRARVLLLTMGVVVALGILLAALMAREKGAPEPLGVPLEAEVLFTGDVDADALLCSTAKAQRGSKVLVRDKDGDLIGRGELDSGEPTVDGCLMGFEVAGLPRVSTYVLHVGELGPITVDLDEVEGGGGRLRFTDPDEPVTFTTTTTTTAPTTTSTVPIADQIATQLEIAPSGIYVDEYNSSHFFVLGFRVHSKATKEISAWQASIVLSATDDLGRTYSMSLLFDCTERMAAGSTIVGSVGSLNSAADDQGCATGEWNANQFIAEEIGLWNALKEGAAPKYVFVLNRITFADGSGLGEAKTGRP